jgi:hypothetical protein
VSPNGSCMKRFVSTMAILGGGETCVVGPIESSLSCWGHALEGDGESQTLLLFLFCFLDMR